MQYTRRKYGLHRNSRNALTSAKELGKPSSMMGLNDMGHNRGSSQFTYKFRLTPSSFMPSDSLKE